MKNESCSSSKHTLPNTILIAITLKTVVTVMQNWLYFIYTASVVWYIISLSV